MAYATIQVLCIVSPGRLIKKVGRNVMDRDFVHNFIFSYIFLNYLWGLFYYAQGTGVRVGRLK